MRGNILQTVDHDFETNVSSGSTGSQCVERIESRCCRLSVFDNMHYYMRFGQAIAADFGSTRRSRNAIVISVDISGYGA